MKIKSALYFILVLFFSNCTNNTRKDYLKDKWYFNSISDIDGNVLKPTEVTDFMIIDNNNFHYSINELNLKASGNYKRTADSIHFSYLSPSDTIRHYKIELLNDSTMIWSENNVFYHFFK